MTALPKLAIVGRPNVGKSALFNRICGQRIAIVDEAEGVTRDRLYAEAEFFGLRFQLIDTGGINAHSRAIFNEEIKRQAEIAIEEADSIIMVVDGQIGITSLDQEVAKILLSTQKPICLAVNKADTFSQAHMIHEFYGLGIKKMVAVSAIQGLSVAELLQTALEGIEPVENDVPNSTMQVAIVGRPNVGKSTLINYIVEDERCIVSPIAGTTRDSIDIAFSWDNQDYILIDTAGIRRKHSEHDVVDKFAAIRTQRAIERADVCILVLDAQEGITAQEKRIAKMIDEEGKSCAIFMNKWDLVKGFRMEHCMKSLRDNVPFLQHCPVLFGSALSGRNLDKLLDEINIIHEESKKRISTSQLNKFLENAFQMRHPPMIMGKRVRVYYMTQIDIQPPTFLLFLNYPDLLTAAYKKYLINQFREQFGFKGAPIVFQLKSRVRKDYAERKAAHDVCDEEEPIEMFEEELVDLPD